MQGGSSGIGYGLKYQVQPKTLNLCVFSNRLSDSLKLETLILMVCTRQDAYRMWKPTQIIPASSPGRWVSKKKMRLSFNCWFDFVCCKFCTRDLSLLSEMKSAITRCTWFGFPRLGLSSYARACFRTLTRSGTSLLVPTTSESSPPSTLLVFDGSPSRFCALSCLITQFIFRRY